MFRAPCSSKTFGKIAFQNCIHIATCYYAHVPNLLFKLKLEEKISFMHLLYQIIIHVRSCQMSSNDQVCGEKREKEFLLWYTLKSWSNQLHHNVHTHFINFIAAAAVFSCAHICYVDSLRLWKSRQFILNNCSARCPFGAQPTMAHFFLGQTRKKNLRSCDHYNFPW